MSYNNTKLVAGLLGYALLACSISGCSFDSFSKTATETSSESSSSATHFTAFTSAVVISEPRIRYGERYIHTFSHAQ